jgi:hypothetical protein
MNERNSLPIKVEKLVERESGEKGHLWAEPSLSDLREKMRWCYDHPEEAKQIGKAGRKTMVEQFNPQAVGSIVMKHLERISNQLHAPKVAGLPLAEPGEGTSDFVEL